MNLLQRHLRRLDACQDAIDWAEAYPGRDGAKRAWDECQNGEWMLWYAGSVYKTYTNSMRLAACDISETSFVNITDDKMRSVCQNTIDVSRRFVKGLATEEELGSARSAAESAHADIVRKYIPELPK